MNQAYSECHAHIALDGLDYKKMKALHNETPCIDIIHKNLKAYKNANISFIRDGGDKWGVSKLAKSIAKEDDIDFRSPIYAIYKEGYYGSILGEAFSDMKDYKRLVKRVHDNNGDFIKIMASGIMDFNEYGKITPSGLSKKELKDMVKIAHDMGLSVMAHTNGATEISNAIEARVDSIEHGFFMENESVFALKEEKIVWIPTYTPVANLLSEDKFNHEIINRILELHKANIIHAIAQNVNLGLGSDAGSFPVPHAKGTISEYAYLSSICQNSEKLNQILKKTETLVKIKFMRN